METVKWIGERILIPILVIVAALWIFSKCTAASGCDCKETETPKATSDEPQNT